MARGVQADRVNDQTAFAVSLSTLVHELQRERDLSAGWVGSGRDAGYGGVVTQRVAVNQALRAFRRDAHNLGTDDGARRSGSGSTTPWRGSTGSTTSASGSRATRTSR